MLTRIHSIAVQGLDALSIDVEVDVTKSDQLSLLVVGLPSTAVKESKDRVLAAIRNTGFSIGCIRCTVNLAPANLKKEGTFYDLPIALGLLLSAEKIPPNETHKDFLIVGELGLSGETRPIRGALAMAILARESGKKGIMIPAANAQEAAAVPDIQVIPISSLGDAVKFLQTPHSDNNRAPCTALFRQAPPSIDFAEIKGQQHAKRAVEIAAAGGHNIILSGPPGSGKTMLAKAMIGIMPALSVEEALETTKIHSVAGLLPEGKSLVTQRPFRSPHHTVSYAGLVGGGVFPRPGEVTLAHNGILFLDELPEFSRAVLEVLRQPLEDRKVTISRANGSITYPTKFICIAAMNPCPCGYLGHPEKACKDTEQQIQRYRGKISGPLLDRIDIHIEVSALRYGEMLMGIPGESSAMIRERVEKARTIQSQRLKGGKTNAEMTSKELKEHASIDAGCREVLRQAIEQMGISARACDRLIRVGRTIADLADRPEILQEHLMEALSFR